MDLNLLPTKARPDRRRRGFVLVYSLVVMLALLALASLAVDYGHVQLAKLQVQRAADMAARAAAFQIATVGANADTATSVATAAAATVVGMNASDGAPLALGPGDVQVGNWDDGRTPAFSTARLPYNAVQVTVRRDGVANPRVPLALAPLVGMTNLVVLGTAVAHVQPPPSPYGMVGIDSVTFGSVGVLAGVTGDLVSNGPVSIGVPTGLGVSVSGNVQSYGSAVAKGPLVTVGGTTSPLPVALSYADVRVPTANDNPAIAHYLNGYNDFTSVLGATIPAGTYVVHDLNVVAGAAVTVAGPVTFYVTGSLNLAASVNLLGDTNTDPQNFTVNVATGGRVNFLAPLVVPVAMTLYAPRSDIVVAVGVTQYTGMLVGKTLTVAVPALSRFVEVKPAAKPPTVTIDQ